MKKEHNKIVLNGVRIAGKAVSVCEVDSHGNMFRMTISKHGVKRSSDGGYIIFVEATK